MKGKQHTSESGQAVVLMVLAMVALMGFAALAIDGGMLYADRRFAQDGADAASMAGGGIGSQALDNLGVTDSTWSTNENCTSGSIATAATAARQAAMSRGASDDAAIDEDISDGHGVETVCGTETISAARVAGGGHFTLYEGHYMDIHTEVTRDTQTSFIQFVFGGATKNTVSAITRIRPRQPAAYGFAIVAMNPNGCSGNSNGVQMHGLGGSASLFVQGGGVFSNGCMDVDGNVDVAVDNGSVAYFDTANNNDLDAIAITNPTNDNPASATQLAESALRIPQNAFDTQIPDCNAPGAHIVTGNWLKNPDNQPLESGLYCIDGGLNVNNSHTTLTGENVTLLFRGGGVTINGGEMHLSAPLTTDYAPAMKGTLIYMPRKYYDCSRSSSPTNVLQINGNADDTFTGTILAPCSDISLNGTTSNVAFHSQVIGYNVSVGGNSDTEVIYDGGEQSLRPAFVDLFR